MMDSAHLTRLVQRLDCGDENAHADFVRLLQAQGTPLVEPLAVTRNEVLVTFVYRDAHARRVRVMKGHEDPRDAMLSRVRDTDLWARSYRMPADARFTYCFGPDFPEAPPSPEEMAQLERKLRADPYNRNRVGTQQSLCELPLAPSSPFTLVRRKVSAGEVHAYKITSARLGNTRNVHVYIPPGFDVAHGPYPLLVLFDGIDYLAAIGRVPIRVEKREGAFFRLVNSQRAVLPDGHRRNAPWENVPGSCSGCVTTSRSRSAC